MTTPHDSPAYLLQCAYRTNNSMGDGIDQLEAILALRHELDEQEDHAALTARGEGATWQEIGDALGITRQAAQQRWDRMDDRITRRIVGHGIRLPPIG